MKAKIFTEDHKGQNYFAKALTSNIFIGSSSGRIPPNPTTIKMVSKVSLNPQIEYYSCGPLLGCGWPLTLMLGSRRDAIQM